MEEVQILVGISFALLGGILQGAMLWPMKLMEKWDWENAWLAFSAAAYFLAPWALALWSVPHLVEALGKVSTRVLGMTFLFGLGWGLSGFCPGPALANLGALQIEALLFVPTMAIGMLLAQRFLRADR